MREIKKTTFLAVIVLILLSSVGYGAEWKYFCTHGGSDWFYDTQSVSRGQKTIKVWTKEVFSDQTKKEIIKKNATQPGIDNICYSQGRYEVNCSKILYRPLSIVLYSFEGKVIDSESRSDSPFVEIFPDNLMAKLVEIICK